MSDIKIQPSATGSATVTLTAPATSTARTVTLPDATGTLLNSDGSGANLSGVATLDGNSNLGVGTASTTNFSNYKTIATNDATGGMFEIMIGGARTFNIQSTASLTNMQTRTNIPIAFEINTTEKMRLTSDGLTFNGDTAAANALDDYEEGNWTPTLTGSGTISHRVGKYVKIGNQIMVQGEIRSTSYNNSGATDVQIGGLPYSSFNENNYNFAANITPISGFNLASDHGIVGYMSPNQSHINLFGLNQSAGANYDVLQQGEMGTTVEVFFAVHYRTN